MILIRHVSQPKNADPGTQVLSAYETAEKSRVSKYYVFLFRFSDFLETGFRFECRRCGREYLHRFNFCLWGSCFGTYPFSTDGSCQCPNERAPTRNGRCSPDRSESRNVRTARKTFSSYTDDPFVY